MAYMAYVGTLNVRHVGWKGLPEIERQAWEAAADAVVESAMVEWSEGYNGGSHPVDCQCADCVTG